MSQTFKPDSQKQNELSNNQSSGQLKRSLSVLDVVMITVSGVTPSSSIFVIAPFAIQSAGSGAFLSFVLGAILATAFAFCYAELGAAHPHEGGEYIIIQRLFGRLAGMQMYLFMMCIVIFIPAVLATGAATYLNSALATHFNSATVALVIVLLSYGLGILNIKTNAVLTGMFLGLELLLLGLIVWLGFSQIHQPLSVLITPQVPDASGALIAAPIAIVVAMIGTALFSYNGFGAAIYMAEDMRETGKPMARVVLASLAVVVLVELLAITALILGAPSLSALAQNVDPIGYLMTQLSSPLVARIISAGIFLSVFNAIIALVVQTSRFLFASGRDNMWPTPVSRMLIKLHPKTGTPWAAVLLFAVPSALLSFNSNLGALTSFTVVLILIAYLMMASASLISRRNTSIKHPYLMPLWPLPALVAIVGCCYTLWTILIVSPPRDFLIIGAVILVGLIMMRSSGAKILAPKVISHSPAKE